MASIKHGQVSKPPSFSSWWKHLRKYGKRAFWKRERKAAKHMQFRTAEHPTKKEGTTT